MKRFFFRVLPIALLSVLAFPSCGGGGDKNGGGDQFVSVSAFKSGSAGYVMVGSPRVMIVSQGVPNNVHPGNSSFNKIQRPNPGLYAVEDEKLSTEEAWADFIGDMDVADYGETSTYVNVSVSHSSDNQFALQGSATYTVTADKSLGYMVLMFDDIAGSSGNVEFQSLIHFMGALTRSDLTYDTHGDSSDNSGVTPGSEERILITTLTGSEMHLWFNFQTNMVMAELRYVCIGNRINTNTGHEFVTPIEMRGVWRVTHPFLKTAQ